MSKDQDIWFAAKYYGWGWSLPVAWQGWFVLLGYVVLLIVGSYVLLPGQRAQFFGFFAVLSAGLIGICWLKGEKPRWRWGKE